MNQNLKITSDLYAEQVASDKMINQKFIFESILHCNDTNTLSAL
jgi:hypothetical protein